MIALESGETILYPTDTVWGIGCNLSDNATKKIFELKDYSNGLICLASSFEMISKYADISEIEKLNKFQMTPLPHLYLIIQKHLQFCTRKQ